MTQPSVKEGILDWFHQNDLPSGVSSFDELVLIAAKCVMPSNLDAEAHVSRYPDSLWNNFLDEVGRDKSNGIHPHSIVTDSRKRLIQCASEAYASKSTKSNSRVAGRLKLRPEIYSMLNKLSHRQYEAACCLACQKLGATELKLTPPGNEGGIDFLAVIETRSVFKGFTGLDRFRIVGQAKMYANKVSVSEARSFNDTLADVRTLSPQLAHHLPAWFRNVHTPIVGWIVGHKNFQSGCISKCQSNGVMLLNTKTLTEIFSFAPDIGSTESPEHIALKLKGELFELLKRHS